MEICEENKNGLVKSRTLVKDISEIDKYGRLLRLEILLADRA